MMPSCPHLLWYKYLLILCSAAGYLYSVFKERERSLNKWHGGSSVNAIGEPPIEPLEWYFFKSGPVFFSLTSILTLWQRRISIVLCALVHDFRTRNWIYILIIDLGLRTRKSIYCIYSPLGLSRFENKEYSLCFVLWAVYAFRKRITF